MTRIANETTVDPAPHGAVPPAVRRLRLWPGIAILAALWAAKLYGQLGPGGPKQFFYCLIIAPVAATLLTMLWWLLASRLRWTDRVLIVGLFVASAVGAGVVAGQNFPIMALIMYSLPILLSIWVGWLVISYPLAWPIRRAVLALLIVAAWVPFALLRVDGMDGSFASTFNWRWTPTAEERLLAELAAAPAAAPAAAGDESADASAEGAGDSGAPSEAAQGDWPAFRGAARDGRLVGVRIDEDWQKHPPRRLWHHRVGPGWSSVAVIGERVYTQEQRGEGELVVCYDAETGAERWAHGDATRFSEVVAGPGPRATPTFDGGRIFALGASGHLNCLDAASGSVIWMHNIADDSGAKLPQWGFSSSPLVVAGRVIVFAGAPEGKSMLAYDADSGELTWSGGEGTLSYCSPQLSQLDGVDQVLIATDAGLSSFEPATGKVLWHHGWPTENVARIVQPAVLAGGDVLVGTGMNVGTRRLSIAKTSDQWSVDEQWTSCAIKPYYNDLVVYDGNLYGFDNNIFMCVGLDDGKMRWRKRGYGSGQVLLLADQGLLLVLAEDGKVALVAADPKEHKELGQFQAIEGKTWNHPVVAHGKLFVRNGEEMACFELPMADATQARLDGDEPVR